MGRLLKNFMMCLAVGSVLPVYAGTVLYSTGFEAPTFTAGMSVNGQNGWETFSPASASQIENSFADSGLQALDVLPALAIGDQAGAVYALSTSANEIEMSADIYLASSTIQSAWQFAAIGPAGLGFIGGVDITNTGAIDLITTGFPAVATLAYNTWEDFDFVYNFTTQTYSFSLNGTLISSNVAFCGNNSGPCNGATVSTFGEGAFDTLFPSAGANDIGYMDNFSISSVSSVPEPGSLMLLGAGLAALIAWRRKV
jgi:hypothetical protein